MAGLKSPKLFNSLGERLQYIGDILLNLDYWDCECDKKFIHSIGLEKCDICGYEQNECPSSRESEVQTLHRDII